MGLWRSLLRAEIRLHSSTVWGSTAGNPSSVLPAVKIKQESRIPKTAKQSDFCWLQNCMETYFMATHHGMGQEASLDPNCAHSEPFEMPQLEQQQLEDGWVSSMSIFQALLPGRTLLLSPSLLGMPFPAGVLQLESFLVSGARALSGSLIISAHHLYLMGRRHKIELPGLITD